MEDLRRTVEGPLEYRIEGVSPADSFETTIGVSESAAEPFFRAEDISAVDLQGNHQNNDIDLVSVSFSEGKAEQMQNVASDLGGDLSTAGIFEYLDDELIKTLEVSDGFARMMQAGEWAQQGNFNFAYEDEELAARVAATILEQMNG